MVKKSLRKKRLTTVYLDEDVYEAFDKVARLTDSRKGEILQCSLLLFFACARLGEVPESLRKVIVEEFHKGADLAVLAKVIDTFRRLNIRNFEDVFRLARKLERELE